jgi:hypothetical protein
MKAKEVLGNRDRLQKVLQGSSGTLLDSLTCSLGFVWFGCLVFVRATLRSAQISRNTCKGKPKLIIYENIENIHTPCKGKPKRKV